MTVRRLSASLTQSRLLYTEQSREDERNFLMQWMMMCTQNSMGIPGPSLQMPAQRALPAPERTPLVSGRSAPGSASHGPHLPMSVLSSQVTPRPHFSSQSNVSSSRGTSDEYALTQPNSSVLLATANDHAAISPSKVCDNATLSLSAQQQRIHAPAHSQLQGQPQPLHTSLPTHHTSRLNFQQPVQTPPQQQRGTGLNRNLFSNQRVASETSDPSQIYMNTPSPQTTAMPSVVHHSSVNSQYSN